LARVVDRSIPEPGQLVEVRRRYVVGDIAQGTLPPDIFATGSGSFQPQHLVTLSSVEDDALGEELQVIWEIEPGAMAIEKTPPVGFDAPARLDTFLHAVRWGAASSTDVKAIQAPFRSGIDLEDYQLDPVARAIQMPRVNLLIADDVGLGKTIEAGLVAQELALRSDVRLGRGGVLSSEQQDAAADRLALRHAQTGRQVEQRARDHLHGVSRHAELALWPTGTGGLRRKEAGRRAAPAHTLRRYGYTRARGDQGGVPGQSRRCLGAYSAGDRCGLGGHRSAKLLLAPLSASSATGYTRGPTRAGHNPGQHSGGG
jgi:hypothetical protein